MAADAQAPVRHNPLVAAIRLVLFLVWTIAVATPHAMLLAAGIARATGATAQFYWRGVAAIVGLRLHVTGEVSGRRPVLFVANHSSYLDIVVLGALVRAAFVAKSEVRGWPGIGMIARLGRTVFVERHPRRSVRQRDEMKERLAAAGDSLVLFPEGTSNDGNAVLPFKSALFSAAEIADASGAALAVQPVTVAYIRLDGAPIGREWRDWYAWYGDMDLVPHVWKMVGLGLTDVRVEFHRPVSLAEFPSRKELARHCYDEVAAGLARAYAAA